MNITSTFLATWVQDRLGALYGAQRHATKIIAAAAGVNTRTAENWADGVNAPRSAELLRLMVENKQFRAEVYALIEEAAECRDQ